MAPRTEFESVSLARQASMIDRYTIGAYLGNWADNSQCVYIDFPLENGKHELTEDRSRIYINLEVITDGGQSAIQGYPSIRGCVRVTDYMELCKAFQAIESLSGRLEKTDVIISLIKDRPPEDLYITVRLIQGEVAPSYEGMDLGIAEKLIMKAAQLVTSIDEEEFTVERQRSGDIGTTLEKAVVRRKQASLFKDRMTIERVFNNLKKIAKREGKSSQDIKLKIIAEMLNDAEPLEAKYLGRTLASKMRMGISIMTLMDSIAYAFNNDIDRSYDELLLMDLGEEANKAVKEMRSHQTGPIYRLSEILSKKKKNIKEENRIAGYQMIEETRKKITDLRARIERTYNVHPDIALIARMIRSDGPDRALDIPVTYGVPLRSMLGERLKSIEDIFEKLNGKCAFEYKYDGLRIQAHVRGSVGSREVQLFSRQLENITEQYPDVVSVLKERFTGHDCIVEGECVPIDRGNGTLLPFQVISQRRGRKFDLEAKMEEVPVHLVLFDCLMYDGMELISSPFLQRRSEIEKIFPGITDSIDPATGLSLSRMEIIKDVNKGESFFNKALEDGCEGIMAKSISDDSIYQAGNRGWNWIKLKRDYRAELSDTLDLVVVGAFHGSGKRKGLYGALLMGVFNEELSRYETLCKLGTGFTDEILKELIERLEPLALESPPLNLFSKMDADIYFHPSAILEVMGAEISYSPVHTAGMGSLESGTGFALRFPRFTGRFRDDKGPEQATTVEEVIRMYGLQKKRT